MEKIVEQLLTKQLAKLCQNPDFDISYWNQFQREQDLNKIRNQLKDELVVNPEYYDRISNGNKERCEFIQDNIKTYIGFTQNLTVISAHKFLIKSLAQLISQYIALYELDQLEFEEGEYENYQQVANAHKQTTENNNLIHFQNIITVLETALNNPDKRQEISKILMSIGEILDSGNHKDCVFLQDIIEHI